MRDGERGGAGGRSGAREGWGGGEVDLPTPTRLAMSLFEYPSSCRVTIARRVASEVSVVTADHKQYGYVTSTLYQKPVILDS